MFRQLSTRVLSRSFRPFSTEISSSPPSDVAFSAAWKKIVPNIEPPNTPLAFMNPRPHIPSSIPSKLTVNFVLPYADSPLHQTGLSCRWSKIGQLTRLQTIKNSGSLKVSPRMVKPQEVLVDMVIVPATTGQMGVLPGHVATIAELKPGVMSVHEGNDTKKYFISGGFAFIHANSYADIIAIESVPLDQIDPTMVQKGLAEFTQKLGSASTDLEKAEAQIGVDVHSALNAALSG